MNIQLEHRLVFPNRPALAEPLPAKIEKPTLNVDGGEIHVTTACPFCLFLFLRVQFS